MSNKTDEELEIVGQLRDLSKTLDKIFEEKGRRLYAAERDLGKLNSDEKINLAMELLKQVFKDMSFLDIKQIANFPYKQITWEDVLNKLESHMKY